MHKIKYMDTKYWEFSIYFSRELLPYFENLKSNLKQKLVDSKNCISILVDEQNYVFSLALEKCDYQKNLLFLKESIADIVLIYYKPKFIIKSIKNIDMKSHDNTILIDILANFDYLDNKKYIIDNLSFCSKLFFDSFVYFRLKKLVLDWKETAELVNQNSLFLNDIKTKKELSKFLLDGIASQIDVVRLSQKDKTYFITNNEKNLNYNSIFYSQNEYDDVLFSLINKYPKKIEVANYKKFDVHFIQNLYDLFGNRIELVE